MHEPLAIILAAGKGKRMGSELPKVLVPVCGRPMIRYVIDAVRAAGINRMLVVVGYRADLVRRELAGDQGLEFVVQDRTTGHRPRSHDVRGPSGRAGRSRAHPGRRFADGAGVVAAVAVGRIRGSSPRLFAGHGKKSRTRPVWAASSETGTAKFSAIVEEKDATPDQRAITEVNLQHLRFSAGCPVIVPQAVDGQQRSRRVLPDRLPRCP